MKKTSSSNPSRWAGTAFILFFLAAFCGGLCLDFAGIKWWPLLPAGAVCLLSAIALYTDWIMHFLGDGKPTIDEHATALLDGITFTIREGRPMRVASPRPCE